MFKSRQPVRMQEKEAVTRSTKERKRGDVDVKRSKSPADEGGRLVAHPSLLTTHDRGRLGCTE